LEQNGHIVLFIASAAHDADRQGTIGSLELKHTEPKEVDGGLVFLTSGIA
jgi:hypothetical protein